MTSKAQTGRKKKVKRNDNNNNYAHIITKILTFLVSKIHELEAYNSQFEIQQELMIDKMKSMEIEMLKHSDVKADCIREF